MIDINKKYRTRDGREVRIYSVDANNLDTVHGAHLHKDGQWMVASWGMDGARCGYEETSMDLIEVKPRIQKTVWLSFWSNNYIEATREKPEWRIARNRDMGLPYACVRVEIDAEEGEGL